MAARLRTAGRGHRAEAAGKCSPPLTSPSPPPPPPPPGEPGADRPEQPAAPHGPGSAAGHAWARPPWRGSLRRPPGAYGPAAGPCRAGC